MQKCSKSWSRTLWKSQLFNKITFLLLFKHHPLKLQKGAALFLGYGWKIGQVNIIYSKQNYTAIIYCMTLLASVLEAKPTLSKLWILSCGAGGTRSAERESKGTEAKISDWSHMQVCFFLFEETIMLNEVNKSHAKHEGGIKWLFYECYLIRHVNFSHAR